MKSIQRTKVAMFALLIVFAISCKQRTETPFELKGKLEGITDGRAILSPVESNNSDEMEVEEPISDTVAIKNGEFVFTGDYPKPAQYAVFVEGKKYPIYFYIENAKMTLVGHADTLYQAEVTGGAVNGADKMHSDQYVRLIKKYKLDSLSNALRDSTLDRDVVKKEYDATIEKMRSEYDQMNMDYIKNNPASYYSAVLVERQSYGLGAEEVEKMLNMLDPALDEYSIVEDLHKLVANMKAIDVGVGGFTSEAPDLSYKVDESFAGKIHSDIAYLAIFSNDQICGLRKDGDVILFDSKGTKTGGFKTTLNSKPTAIAINQTDNNVFVLGTINETKEIKSRGKTYKIDTPMGVECFIYDSKGNELKKLELAELKSATGAKVLNNKLLVADYNNRMIAIYDLATDKLETSIKDMRACCRILDFGVNDQNEILVANLGAFRVQAFDYSGTIKYAFGKRGRELNDFHGCCNPVNVSWLPNGGIVTVEKDPTRIKIFTKSGARQIQGVQELVKGCAYIPMASDSKNNIYLASAMSGVVKCSPQ